MRRCACGCRRRVQGAVRGKPRRYVSGHNFRVLKRTTAHRLAIAAALRRAWLKKRVRLPVGTTRKNAQGYVVVKVVPGKGQWALEHVIAAEKMLRRALRKAEVVHHIDGDRANNAPSNLFVCRDRSHHNAVHRSQDEALRALLRVGLVRFNGGRYEAVLPK